MKASNAFVAAALAGVFAATTAAASVASILPGDKEKDDCPGKDKEKKEETVISGEKDKDKDECPDKKKEELVVSGEKEKDKDECPDKKKEEVVVSGEKEKDKEDCPDKDKEKEEIL